MSGTYLLKKKEARERYQKYSWLKDTFTREQKWKNFHVFFIVNIYKKKKVLGCKAVYILLTFFWITVLNNTLIIYIFFGDVFFINHSYYC